MAMEGHPHLSLAGHVPSSGETLGDTKRQNRNTSGSTCIRGSNFRHPRRR
eukprot:jgi/Botrbrau1/8317/Bobra.0081s0006.1